MHKDSWDVLKAIQPNDQALGGILSGSTSVFGKELLVNSVDGTNTHFLHKKSSDSADYDLNCPSQAAFIDADPKYSDR